MCLVEVSGGYKHDTKMWKIVHVDIDLGVGFMKYSPMGLVAERISARQVIWVHISTNTYVLSHIRNSISHVSISCIKNVICHDNFKYDTDVLGRLRLWSELAAVRYYGGSCRFIPV